ncbi:MAG: four-helix bundle copper-binding protein [Nitrosomonadales bacterium]|nr:four-helix bundle copper-binding protein [Nitrosomonadales bacterium]
MNRRELLLGGMALAGAAVVGRAQAAGHAHEHHHGAPANASLAAATSDCVQKGEVCLSHCLELLGKGDRDMAACAQSVNQMLAVCGALQQLANQNSKQTARLAAIAMDVCKQCEEECKKHADKHEQCKACGESCAACYKECKKVAA